MKRISFAFAILALAILSCGQYVTATPTQLPTHAPKTSTALAITATSETALPMHAVATTAVWTATVARAQINVRTDPAGDPTGDYLSEGDTVSIIRCISDEVIGDWCKVQEPAGADWEQPTAWVYRGCLSDNPQKLGCEAK